MSIISLIIILALIGVVLWAVQTYVPMPQPFKQLITVVVIVAVLLWLLQVFGVFGGLNNVRVGELSNQVPYHGILVYNT